MLPSLPKASGILAPGYQSQPLSAVRLSRTLLASQPTHALASQLSAAASPSRRQTQLGAPRSFHSSSPYSPQPTHLPLSSRPLPSTRPVSPPRPLPAPAKLGSLCDDGSRPGILFPPDFPFQAKPKRVVVLCTQPICCKDTKRGCHCKHLRSYLRKQLPKLIPVPCLTNPPSTLYYERPPGYQPKPRTPPRMQPGPRPSTPPAPRRRHARRILFRSPEQSTPSRPKRTLVDSSPTPRSYLAANRDVSDPVIPSSKTSTPVTPTSPEPSWLAYRPLLTPPTPCMPLAHFARSTPSPLPDLSFADTAPSWDADLDELSDLCNNPIPLDDCNTDQLRIIWANLGRQFQRQQEMIDELVAAATDRPPPPSLVPESLGTASHPQPPLVTHSSPVPSNTSDIKRHFRSLRSEPLVIQAPRPVAPSDPRNTSKWYNWKRCGTIAATTVAALALAYAFW